MNNKVWYINSSETKLFKQDNNEFRVMINGDDIQSEAEFLYAIAEGFHFPVYSENERKYIKWYPTAFKHPNNQVVSWDGLNDWITDLSWIESDRICLIIVNFSSFLKEFPNEKKYIINIFKEVILPWWENDVVDYVVGGKIKHFDLYLVD